jgi:hypothetical protein
MIGKNLQWLASAVELSSFHLQLSVSRGAVNHFLNFSSALRHMVVPLTEIPAVGEHEVNRDFWPGWTLMLSALRVLVRKQQVRSTARLTSRLSEHRTSMIGQ